MASECSAHLNSNVFIPLALISKIKFPSVKRYRHRYDGDGDLLLSLLPNCENPTATALEKFVMPCLSSNIFNYID